MFSTNPCPCFITKEDFEEDVEEVNHSSRTPQKLRDCQRSENSPKIAAGGTRKPKQGESHIKKNSLPDYVALSKYKYFIRIFFFCNDLFLVLF
jgi:hypothetical protein